MTVFVIIVILIILWAIYICKSSDNDIKKNKMIMERKFGEILKWKLYCNYYGGFRTVSDYEICEIMKFESKIDIIDNDNSIISVIVNNFDKQTGNNHNGIILDMFSDINKDKFL